MSGDMQYRINRMWDSTIRSNVSPARFFWEWINYIHSHLGLTVVECGTATTSHGATIPSEWRNWNGSDDPTALTPIPMDKNSWVVFRAVNADTQLAGGGNMPWEAKIQATWGGTTYEDPSGTDYGQDGSSDCVVLRCSPAGIWAGTPTWDFVAPSGEDISPDFLVMTGADVDFYLDIIGDDDTIVWKGSAGDISTEDLKERSRGGYIGTTVQRSSHITWPFLLTAGIITNSDASSIVGYQVNSRCTNFDNFVWRWNGSWSWPSFTLGRDDTAVDGHRMDTWHNETISWMSPSTYTGDEVLPAILFREAVSPDRYDILGELRLVVVTGYSYGQNVVLGTNSDLIQICIDAGTYGGIAIPWESGEVPIW